MSKKLILVIGGTGAQGLAIIDKLLAPSEDGSPTPYSIRVLSRDPENSRAKELAAKGVELVKGSTSEFSSVTAALQGAYGAFVNTDTFTLGEEKELWTGIRIFELAKRAGVRHYVWSSLDYLGELTNYDPAYDVPHYTKGRVHEFMKSQPSVVSDTDMSWSVITSGPYMDMLHNSVFGPLKKREDGTVVFATPMSRGHVPMIALSDFGFFARYTFDNRASTSRADLKIASDWVNWEYLKQTFEKAEVIYQTLGGPEEPNSWFSNFKHVDRPHGTDLKPGEGVRTWRELQTPWYSLYRDEIIKRDFEWLRKINPKGHTLESWMREENYGATMWSKRLLIKLSEDALKSDPSLGLNMERVAQL